MPPAIAMPFGVDCMHAPRKPIARHFISMSEHLTLGALRSPCARNRRPPHLKPPTRPRPFPPAKTRPPSPPPNSSPDNRSSRAGRAQHI
eukprot:scaffold3204_cov97-Isochrysis_galbana.AAC.2